MFGATGAVVGVTPVQAELMADMNAHLLHEGAVVFARVTVDWNGTGCALRNGAIVQGNVVSVTPYRRQGSKGSEVVLAFTEAQCGDLKMGAFQLLLAAVAAPPQKQRYGHDLGLPLSTAGCGEAWLLSGSCR